jgi:hypothetical protein
LPIDYTKGGSTFETPAVYCTSVGKQPFLGGRARRSGNIACAKYTLFGQRIAMGFDAASNGRMTAGLTENGMVSI